jgi:hypothetical protein
LSANNDRVVNDRKLSESSYEHVIDVSFEQVDVVGWLFSLPNDEYRRCCQPDHIACGLTSTDDGQPMCVGVETIGVWLMVHRYAVQIHRPDRCELVSVSDVFAPRGGRAKAQITWTLSIEAVDEDRSKYTNSIVVSPTDGFVKLLDESGARWELSDVNEHNSRETPSFAASIARYSLAKAGTARGTSHD